MNQLKRETHGLKILENDIWAERIPHEEFKKLNITRDLPLSNVLEVWTYTKLNETKRIAGIIKERIIQGIDDSE